MRRFPGGSRRVVGLAWIRTDGRWVRYLVRLNEAHGNAWEQLIRHEQEAPCLWCLEGMVIEEDPGRWRCLSCLQLYSIIGTPV